jgi:hypothetical protein
VFIVCNETSRDKAVIVVVLLPHGGMVLEMVITIILVLVGLLLWLPVIIHSHMRWVLVVVEQDSIR